jgi:hypothetical protein
MDLMSFIFVCFLNIAYYMGHACALLHIWGSDCHVKSEGACQVRDNTSMVYLGQSRQILIL